MFHRFAFSLLVSVIAAPALAAEEKAPKALRVYFVGNSVTDTINYAGLTELAKSRGYTQVWGRHMIPGAPLQWIQPRTRSRMPSWRGSFKTWRGKWSVPMNWRE